MQRQNTLKMSDEQRQEFARELNALLQKHGVTLDAESYCDIVFLSVIDKEGNWNVLEKPTNDGEFSISKNDFWA